MHHTDIDELDRPIDIADYLSDFPYLARLNGA